jgi:branched-chain amino acid transport system substrate-binding protein
VGSVNSLSGAATFPEASQAAKAVFDRANAKGGVNGHKIQYTALDDKGDPSTAAQSARKLVSDQNAVVLDGSASLVDCEVNAAFYKQSGISSVPGVGVDPGCFASAPIAPVNTGPYVGTQIDLQYASTGKKLALNDESVSASVTDFSPFVLHAQQLGCDGIFFNGVEPTVVGFAKAMAAQGMTTPLLVLSSAYTVQAAQAVGNPAFPMYSASEFAPYTDANSAENADWRSLMQSDNIPLTSFSQGGYLSATYLLDVLKGIKGDITRDSVTKALHSMKPIQNAMVGSPWVFGTAATHNPNQSVKIVRLQQGTWTVADPQWVTAKKS